MTTVCSLSTTDYGHGVITPPRYCSSPSVASNNRSMSDVDSEPASPGFDDSVSATDSLVGQFRRSQSFQVRHDRTLYMILYIICTQRILPCTQCLYAVMRTSYAHSHVHHMHRSYTSIRNVHISCILHAHMYTVIHNVHYHVHNMYKLI